MRVIVLKMFLYAFMHFNAGLNFENIFFYNIDYKSVSISCPIPNFPNWQGERTYEMHAHRNASEHTRPHKHRTAGRVAIG